MDPKTQWLLQAYLPEDSLVMLYGAPNTFKSFIALDWGLSVATGLPWLGAKVPTARKVVYVSAEGQRGIRQRGGAWLEARGLKPEAARGLVFVTQPVDVPSPRAFGTFLTALGTWLGKEERLGLIVFDTVARCFGGLDENSTRDMGLFVKACDLLRLWFPAVTVLLVHHSGKDETLGARGSIALHGATDAIYQTWRRRGKDVSLRNPRNKDQDELTPMPITMKEVGDSLVVTRGEAREESGGAGEAAVDRASALLDYLPAEGLGFSAWFAASPLTVERTFTRYVKRLVRGKMVRTEGNFYYKELGRT